MLYFVICTLDPHIPMSLQTITLYVRPLRGCTKLEKTVAHPLKGIGQPLAVFILLVHAGEDSGY